MPTYLASDGRAAIRMFSTEPDALIYWYYNHCKGFLYKLHDDSGIIIDEAKKDTHMWNSHSLFKTGNQSQAEAIKKYMNELVQSVIQPSVQSAIQPSVQAAIQPSVQAAIQPPVQAAIQPPVQAAIQPPVQAAIQLPVQAAIQPPVANMNHNPQTESNNAILLEKHNLEEEIKRLRTFVTISDAEIIQKNKEIEEAWRLELEERNKLEQQKQSIQREKQREDEAEKIFESGKQTYRQIKREICTGLTTPENIPEQFLRRYMVYKRMDDGGLIDLPGDWDIYQDYTEQLKEEEFNSDREKYIVLKDNIDRGECKETDVPLEFENQYRVFNVMEKQGVLNDPDSYDLFLELLGDYMGAWNDCKYALSNDAHYLEDVNIKTQEVLANDETDDDGPLLSIEEAREKYGIVAGTEAAEQLQGMHSFLDQ